MKRFLDEGKRSVGVEAPTRQKRLLHRRHLELTAMLRRRRHGEAGGLQSPEVFPPQLGIDNMKGPVAMLDPFLDERKQDTVLLVRVVKEGTDMALWAQHRASEPDRSGALTRNSPAKLGLVIGGIRRVLLQPNMKDEGPKRVLR
jgi:hypothetical protein